MGIDDAKRGKSRFSLNANGQVQAVRQQKTWESQQRFVHLFGYDSELNLNQQGFATEYGDSNVVSLDDARVKRQSRQYDKAGRVLDTGRFRYHYDKCGRVVEKTEYKDGFRPKTTRFVWNGDDRLTHIELPDGGRYRYRYDPLGRRVAKECLSTRRITEYLWDGANIVQHSQKTADGSVIQEIEYLYEPETFRPLAQVTHKADQASQLHYIVTDHAGTPQELCSENGDVVWQGEQALWGHYQKRNALPNHGFRENAQNDELYCDLRYQGQIEDRESGLYYNVNRYYDADSGQYLSPDPIGFAGGLRPQAYVFNPLDWVDPLGLAKCPKITKDSSGRIIQWDSEVSPEDIGTGTATNQKARDYARSLGAHNDDAGHALGSKLGGTGTNTDNIFPQAPKVNRGPFRVMEKNIAERVNQTGQSAKLTVKANYDGPSTRPSSLEYTAVFEDGTKMYRKFGN
ncbi:RHS repeat-associated core domain-containing protein [Vibrio vulnificus]|uniref:RHS repeat-associated core domain-containing protein n=1 Tax=Vibrio vulnificus TaxID=672 RepID=UPI00092732D7|nr:RHS repeat-associated core domain-containing protein [Vibrio vulnificus]OJI58939.1 putative deoxyribonuclease RhsC [Vibrio vulnificus]